MSIAIPPLNAALTASTAQPHAHGHKRSSQLDLTADTDAAGSPAAQVPVGPTNNFFGRLLGSAARLIGIQLPSAAPQTALNGSAAPQSSTAAQKLDLMA